ncbi:MAG: EF-hand domain-containing protein, partial [Alphaproteobacteria bacterium]|nr:EF-hand domain-containing protein [Alphaproteobacteria bacterium]
MSSISISLRIMAASLIGFGLVSGTTWAASVTPGAAWTHPQMEGCDLRTSLTPPCEDAFWTFADLSGDGKLSIAELARLAREFKILASLMTAAPWAELEAGAPRDVAKPAMRLMDQLGHWMTPGLGQQLMLNYDYDGDGVLSRDEFFARADQTQPSAMTLVSETVGSIEELTASLQAMANDTMGGGAASSALPLNPTAKGVGKAEGLVIGGVQPRFDAHGGGKALLVGASLSNGNPQTLDVAPRILVVLKDASGRTVAEQTYDHDGSLAPGE